MPFAGAWASYNKLLASQPLLTKALTSLTGFTLGDILAQKFVTPDPEKGYDLMRTIRLGSFGLLVHGPTGHYFYGWLDRQIPGTAMKTVATKVAIDQMLWNPCFGVMFFTYLGLTEGKSVADIKTKIKNDLATAVVGSWTVWIPAHTINFRFIPTDQRLLYINSIQIGYNVFLSFLGNKKAEPEAAEKIDGTKEKVTEKATDAKEKVASATDKAVKKSAADANNPLQKPDEDRSPKEKIEMATKKVTEVDLNKQWHKGKKE